MAEKTLSYLYIYGREDYFLSIYLRQRRLFPIYISMAEKTLSYLYIYDRELFSIYISLTEKTLYYLYIYGREDSFLSIYL